MDMNSTRVIISHYVTFDENYFPVDTNLDFLLELDYSTFHIGQRLFAGTSRSGPATPIGPPPRAVANGAGPA